MQTTRRSTKSIAWFKSTRLSAKFAIRVGKVTNLENVAVRKRPGHDQLRIVLEMM